MGQCEFKHINYYNTGGGSGDNKKKEKRMVMENFVARNIHRPSHISTHCSVTTWVQRELCVVIKPEQKRRKNLRVAVSWEKFNWSYVNMNEWMKDD